MRPVLVLTHAPHEGPGLIGPALGTPYQVRTVLDDPAPRLPRAEELSGLVVMGGPMDADDVAGHPGLAPERELIAAAVASIPDCPGAPELRALIQSQTTLFFPKQLARVAA